MLEIGMVPGGAEGHSPPAPGHNVMSLSVALALEGITSGNLYGRQICWIGKSGFNINNKMFYRLNHNGFTIVANSQ